jgi:hypothetical protein
LSSSHRFRDTLDLELMRHASQDMAGMAASAAVAAAAAAIGGAGGTPPRKASSPLRQQQQQQGTRAGSPLEQQQGPRAGSPLQQQQQQQPDQQSSLAGKPPALKSIRTNSSRSNGKRPSSATGATTVTTSSSWAVPGSVASRFSSFEEYLAAREYELCVELGPGQGVSELIAASHAAALSNGLQVSQCAPMCGCAATQIAQLALK